MNRNHIIIFSASILFFSVFTFVYQIKGSATDYYIPAFKNAIPEEAEIPQEGKYDVMLDSICGPITYYNQSDVRWGNYLWGGQDPISTYGCGPTVMAMLITSFTGNQVLPPEVADWAAANKSWCPGQGSYHRLITESAAAYGLNVSPIKSYNIQSLQETISSGHVIVALMKKGHFTQQGHFIILTRFTENGMLRIIDSNNYQNALQDWDPNLIIHELNYQAGNGGPLWMIGAP